MYRHCVTDPPPALISPLVTATMEHAHGHGSAPDHHETRFITMDHGGGGGPVPVAASPNKPQHRPNLKSAWAILVGFYVHPVLKFDIRNNLKMAQLNFQ